MIILRNKLYAAVDKKGNVVMTSKDALKEARELGYTRKQAVQAAMRFLKKAEEKENKYIDDAKKAGESFAEIIGTRPAIGFIRGRRVKDKHTYSLPHEHRVRIGFHPDQTEPSGIGKKLGFKNFSTTTTHDKLYKLWKKTGDPEIAYKWSQAWGEEVYEKTREEDLGNLKPDPKAMKAADDYAKSLDPEGYAKMKKLNRDLEDAYKGGNPTTVENARGAINRYAKKYIREQKSYSKQDREVVPDDIVKKVKEGGGVIQKDHNGDWRIISMKTKTNKSGKPEFWPQKSKDREDMVKILQSYHSNRH